MDTSDMEKIINSAEPKDVEEIVKDVLKSGEFDVKTEVHRQFPYTKRVSINDIVPEEYQQKLMEIDFTMSQCYWLIGDITNDLVNSVNRERAQVLGKMVSKQDIFEAVGFFCHRTGRSVRYYYECARYFPVEVRQKFEVPFVIYAEARWVKNWELMLTIACDNPMWSAEKVRIEYYKQMGEEPPKSEGKPREKEQEEDEALPEKDELWDGRHYQELILSNLERTVDKLRLTVDRIPMDVPTKIRIGNVILEIQDIMLEIQREG